MVKWCAIPALLLVLATTGLELCGVVGSKYTGAAWAFLPMVAFAKSRVRGWGIAGGFAFAFAVQAAVHFSYPLDVLRLDEGPLWIGPAVWTFMLGACVAVGLVIGAKSRRAESSGARSPAAGLP